MRQIGRTVLVLGLGLGLGLGLTTRLEGASRRGDAADLKLSFRSISEREGGGAGTVTATPTGGESRGCADVEVIGDEAAASCSAREIGAEYVDGLMLAPRYPIDSRRDILLVHGCTVVGCTVSTMNGRLDRASQWPLLVVVKESRGGQEGLVSDASVPEGCREGEWSGKEMQRGRRQIDVSTGI
jgi:hypothetical protein